MIDKSKLQICCICNKTIQPKYLGKDRKDNHDQKNDHDYLVNGCN